jgi:hypothetical protein
MQKKIKYQNRYCRMLSIMRPIAADCRVKIQKHVANKTLKLPENTSSNQEFMKKKTLFDLLFHK